MWLLVLCQRSCDSRFCVSEVMWLPVLCQRSCDSWFCVSEVMWLPVLCVLQVFPEIPVPEMQPELSWRTPGIYVRGHAALPGGNFEPCTALVSLTSFLKCLTRACLHQARAIQHRRVFQSQNRARHTRHTLTHTHIAHTQTHTLYWALTHTNTHANSAHTQYFTSHTHSHARHTHTHLHTGHSHTHTHTHSH